MAHAVHTRHLGRNKSWRKSTARSLAQALLRRERIQTTWAKAKEAQRITERLITLGKQGSLHARRRAQSILNDSDGVHKLFTEIAPRFQNRSGGYTRVLHQGNRSGDGAEMAWIELVELKAKETKTQKPASVKEKPPVTREKPSVRQKPEEPAPERTKKPAVSAEKKPAKPEEKKPRGFIDGLRKFFKRRGDNP